MVGFDNFYTGMLWRQKSLYGTWMLLALDLVCNRTSKLQTSCKEQAFKYSPSRPTLETCRQIGDIKAGRSMCPHWIDPYQEDSEIYLPNFFIFFHVLAPSTATVLKSTPIYHSLRSCAEPPVHAWILSSNSLESPRRNSTRKDSSLWIHWSIVTL